jgi:HSP20 family protein
MIPVPMLRRSRWDRPSDFFGRELERLFWPEAVSEGEVPASYPIDMREEDSTIVIEAEMPGFKREEIDISLEGDMLKISAERKPAETKGKPHVSERKYTRVERVIQLPNTVDEEKAEAHLQDGVLEMRLPKTEKESRKRIEVS